MFVWKHINDYFAAQTELYLVLTLRKCLPHEVACHAASYVEMPERLHAFCDALQIPFSRVKDVQGFDEVPEQFFETSVDEPYHFLKYEKKTYKVYNSEERRLAVGPYFEEELLRLNPSFLHKWFDETHSKLFSVDLVELFISSQVLEQATDDQKSELYYLFSECIGRNWDDALDEYCDDIDRDILCANMDDNYSTCVKDEYYYIYNTDFNYELIPIED